MNRTMASYFDDDNAGKLEFSPFFWVGADFWQISVAYRQPMSMNDAFSTIWSDIGYSVYEYHVKEYLLSWSYTVDDKDCIFCGI